MQTCRRSKITNKLAQVMNESDHFFAVTTAQAACCEAEFERFDHASTQKVNLFVGPVGTSCPSNRPRSHIGRVHRGVMEASPEPHFFHRVTLKSMSQRNRRGPATNLTLAQTALTPHTTTTPTRQARNSMNPLHLFYSTFVSLEHKTA